LHCCKANRRGRSWKNANRVGASLRFLLHSGVDHRFVPRLAGMVNGGRLSVPSSAVYDDSGQLVTASFMDYTMPRADDLKPPSVPSTL